MGSLLGKSLTAVQVAKSKFDRPTNLKPDLLISSLRERVISGYRECTKCNCKSYEGNASTCANSGCGHAFGDHW